MFTKDNRTENFLTQMGVEYVYSNNVAFSDLVSGWSADNIARPVPIREEAVLEYAALMDGGSSAPAPIIHQLGDGTYQVLDGVQRLSASQLNGETKISAYIVRSDSGDLITAIRVISNARLQGRAEPIEWTRRRAVEVLVVQRGMTADEVAKIGGWKPSDIKRIADIIEWNLRIAAIDGPELTDGMIDAISSRVTKDDLTAAPKPVADFLHLLKKAKFSTADAEPCIDEFFAPITKPSRRHKIYCERLERITETPEVQVRLLGRKGTGMRHDVVLLRTLKAANTTLDEIIAEGETIPYIDELIKQVGCLHEKLRSIAPNKKPEQYRVPADMWS